jgi:hypothetical protein
VSRRFFDHDQFDFELQCALGGVAYGCGDVGELFATADRIIDGDADSWCSEWNATGDRIATTAESCAAAGHPVSARAAYLRASAYHALALSAANGTKDPAAVLEPTFRAHRRCFDAYVDLLDLAAERVRIPYEGEHMPGYLFRPAGDGRRRTLVMNNGSDGPVTSIWPVLSAGAVARGYGVLVFDGPGQQSMLFERGIPFRHDWEHVITPVVDFLLARPDVDPDRIALYGISQAGYWVPRALAFEHRIAAAVADPGVVNAFAPWWDNLPPEMRRLLDAGERELFDHWMAVGMEQATPAQRQNYEWRTKPYGLTSAFDVFSAARRYDLGDLTRQITTPMLVTDPEGEQFWPGQSQALYDALPGSKELVHFTAHEGADRHCEPMARTLLEQRMLDWLDEVLATT